VTAAIETEGLGKQYRKLWALTDCTLSIPAGHVVGLVGPNGAGKSTLLNLATGMLAPTTGTIEVLGGRPRTTSAGRVPGPGRAGLRRAVDRRPPQAGRAPQPGLGRGHGAPPDR
jgi:ABC-type branched-subunit amino acid transport system ATPase component